MYSNSKRNAAKAITQGQAGVLNDPIDNLAIAIVQSAAEDYRSYYKRKKRLRKQAEQTTGVKKSDALEALLSVDLQVSRLERFFQSDWCFALSGGTNIAILERLRREQG